MADSRERAREAVVSGRVLVSGSTATKPDRMVAASEPIEVAGPRPRYVSRGGDKLEGALREFGVKATGKRCADLGASTGGFTDCLLQHGAAHVVAIDVGHGQFDWSLRNDPRVEVLEHTDVRRVDADALGPLDLITVDLSFISLRTVMEPTAAVARGALVVALVKPQFEVGRRNVPKGGVVRDSALQVQAVAHVADAAERAGLECLAGAPSVLPGAEGNLEFFLLLRRTG